jgi:hypothetical protein
MGFQRRKFQASEPFEQGSHREEDAGGLVVSGDSRWA